MLAAARRWSLHMKGSKLLSQARELYKSSSGRLTADQELELVTADLRALIEKVGRAGPPIPSDESPIQLPAFEKIRYDTKSIADELLTRLHKFKIDRSKNRIGQTFFQVVKHLWSKNEIDSLVKRLATLKAALDTRVLCSILDNLHANSNQLSTYCDGLAQQSQRIISALLNCNRAASVEVRCDLGTTLAHLISRIETFIHDQHCHTRELLTEHRKPDATNSSTERDLPGITAGLQLFNVSQVEENKLRSGVQSEIVESLRYPIMSNRYETVIDAHPTTFDWAFKDSTDEQLPWSNLATWLKFGNGVYWINGKPGSGKSTFMKHIFDDPRTRRFLDVWCRDENSNYTPLCLASHFFWNSGTDEQRSQIGMLRAILFQVLEQQPDLIPIVMPTIWANQYSKELARSIRASVDPWPLGQLQNAFRLVLKQTEIPIKLCLFVDGLDEFDGDHEDLADLFRNIAESNLSNVKVCLSSRPLVVFKDTFRDCPQLQLQNLTFHDIIHYVKDKMDNNTAFQRLRSQDPESAMELTREVVEKADGVFLWVWIVVKDLLRGVRNLDSMSDLLDRLRVLPNNLASLYEHLMGRIEPRYRVWASKAFQVARAVNEMDTKCTPKSAKRIVHSDWKYEEHGGDSLTLLELYLSVNEDSVNRDEICSMSEDTLMAKCRETEVHITARCACFLETSITATQKTIGPNSPIKYLHRSARDFLEEDARWRDVLHYTRGTEFNPYVSLMASGNLILRRHISSQRASKPDTAVLKVAACHAIAYASYADAYAESHNTQTRLLDDLDDLLINQFIDGPAWCDPLYGVAAQMGLISSFVDFAMFLNLSGYIRVKTKQRHLSTRERATDLLCRRVTEQSRGWFKATTILSVDMASALIELGADVNWKDSRSLSAWDSCLKWVSQDLSDLGPQGCRRMRFFVSNTLPVMKIMLLSGADQQVSVSHENSLHALGNFIRQYLSLKFPLEAGDILWALGQAKSADMAKSFATKRMKSTKT